MMSGGGAGTTGRLPGLPKQALSDLAAVLHAALLPCHQCCMPSHESCATGVPFAPCRHAEAVAEARGLTHEGDSNAPEVLELRGRALYLSGNMAMAQVCLG